MAERGLTLPEVPSPLGMWMIIPVGVWWEHRLQADCREARRRCPAAR